VDQRRLSPDTADDPVANIRNTTNNKAIRNYNMINDNSCGIHTFKTATSQEGARAELLGFESREFVPLCALYTPLIPIQNSTATVTRSSAGSFGV
jgi:hypothetical protein